MRTPKAEALSLERDLAVLEVLAGDPSLSQRQVAVQAGLSTARAHFVLRRLVEKGLVKVRRAAHSKHKFRYLYVLTPSGIEAKARRTYRFMHRMAKEYRVMVRQVEKRLSAAMNRFDKAGPNGTVKLWIAGDGPLAEVVRDLVGLRDDVLLVDREREADLIVVADPEAGRRTEGPSRWVSLA